MPPLCYLNLPLPLSVPMDPAASWFGPCPGGCSQHRGCESPARRAECFPSNTLPSPELWGGFGLLLFSFNLPFPVGKMLLLCRGRSGQSSVGAEGRWMLCATAWEQPERQSRSKELRSEHSPAASPLPSASYLLTLII